jgi:FKBP-type peptidyl-prolyl cis-trans isomerase FklB
LDFESGRLKCLREQPRVPGLSLRGGFHGGAANQHQYQTMKLASTLWVGAALTLSVSAFSADASLATQKQRSSYGVGMNVGKRFRHESIDLDFDAFVKGFKDAMTDAKPGLTDAELNEAMAKLRTDVEQKASEQGEKSKKEGADFLAKNKNEKGVQTTPSGLQYIVIKDGTGPTPKETDTVKVHYRGTLINGTEFDSSYARNEPAVFPVNGVIKGWVEALQKMKVGSKWKLFIPSDLAYGENAQGQIPANATLIFEVELLGIEKPAGK